MTIIFLVIVLLPVLDCGRVIRWRVGVEGRVVALLLSLHAPGTACQICLPFPKKSAADDLIEAEVVVFARENPAKPFSLIGVEILKGEIGDNKAIDLFLDSQSRRTLAVYPDREIVCVRENSDPDANWRRIGMTNETYEPVIREVIERSPEFRAHPDKRLAYFSKYLGHEDDQLRTVAHIEVARAPYDDIVALESPLTPEQIRSFLGNIRYAEWHALYILLLAQSEAEEDRKRIRESMRSAQEFSITNQLAAWATAWIEIDEAKALDSLGEHYLRNAARKPEELRAVIAALSVHGTNGHIHLRDRIVDAYRTVLETHPAMASQIVDDLRKWNRWELSNSMVAIADSEKAALDLKDILKLRAYAKDAIEAGTLETTADRSSGTDNVPPWIWMLSGAALVLLSLRLAVKRHKADTLPRKLHRGSRSDESW